MVEFFGHFIMKVFGRALGCKREVCRGERDRGMMGFWVVEKTKVVFEILFSYEKSNGCFGHFVDFFSSGKVTPST